jgi:hypothetical protein
MPGQIESLLEQGIDAARDHESKRARDILIRVIELDQYCEKAWLWLSSVVETPADKEICLENALYINPDNTYAAMGLQHLRQQSTSPPSPSILPRLSGKQTLEEQAWAPSTDKTQPPPRVRVCPRCGFQNPGWAYLCDRCGGNLRRVNVREVLRESSKPRAANPLTLIEAWGGTLVFSALSAFRPEIELASWGRTTTALLISVILASAIRIASAVFVPVLVNQGQYDLRSQFAGDVLEWARQTFLLSLALALLWVVATVTTWLAARMMGGRQKLRVHAHLVMVVASAWVLLGALVAALIILTPYLVARTSPLELPFELVFDFVAIVIGVVGLVWLTLVTRISHDLTPSRAALATTMIAVLGALLSFGLNLLSDGLFADAVARSILVFFLPWLG